MGYILKYVLSRLLLLVTVIAVGMLVKAKFFPSDLPRSVNSKDTSGMNFRSENNPLLDLRK
jgi:hypothetical protein